MKPIRIIIHHSLTKDSQTVSVGAIRNYHIDINGWSDIGYHFLIEDLRGQTEIVVGRMPDRPGAHCRGNNLDSIGICVVGNFDLKHPPIQSWEKAVALVKYLKRVFKIDVVLGHNELNASKSCPGKYFDMDKFRAETS